MKAVIQRVTRAAVVVEGRVVSQIGPGIVTLLGFAHADEPAALAKLIQKIVELRIFPDANGKMDLSLRDMGYEHLIVPQFTLVADCEAGRRPSFSQAASPAIAQQLYAQALQFSEAQGVPTRGGVFQANMQVELVNDGPVTFVYPL